MTEDRGPALIATGGWCAPSEVIYDLADKGEPDPFSGFPRVSVSRGGFHFPQPGTPEWERAEADRRALDGLRAMVTRLVGDVVRAQDEAIEVAWLTRPEGTAVHVHAPKWWPLNAHAALRGPYRFIGISLEPANRMRDAIHHHEATMYDEYDDEYDD